jgi:hypothetical protein
VGKTEEMRKENGKFSSLKTISLYFSQEMLRKNLLTSWEHYLSPEIAKELKLICEEFDVKPNAAGTKTGSPDPSNGEWTDYLLYEMAFCKSAPCLTRMICEIAGKILVDGEAPLPYNGYYFITANYQYGRMLPSARILCHRNKIISAGEAFVFRGESLGHSKKKNGLHYVGFNYESKTTFETVLHEIMHIKLSEDGNKAYSQFEQLFEEAVEEAGREMRLPLDKSIWRWPGIKEEHELLGKEFKNLADKIEPHLKSWEINPKSPNL